MAYQDGSLLPSLAYDNGDAFCKSLDFIVISDFKKCFLCRQMEGATAIGAFHWPFLHVYTYSLTCNFETQLFQRSGSTTSRIHRNDRSRATDMVGSLCRDGVLFLISYTGPPA